MVDEKPALPFGSFLFPRIFQAFRMSIQPSKLAIAFAAVTMISIVGGIMDLSRTVIVDLGYTRAALRDGCGPPQESRHHRTGHLPAARCQPEAELHRIEKGFHRAGESDRGLPYALAFRRQ